jgi:MFS superfamily sulfate permease-like transporter
MSGAAVAMAIVLFISFAVGITVGFILVIAVSARRADRAERQNRSAPPPRGRWPYLPETGPHDEEPHEPGWWHDRGSG